MTDPPTDRLNTLSIRLGQGGAAATTPEAAATTTSTLTLRKYSDESGKECLSLAKINNERI